MNTQALPPMSCTGAFRAGGYRAAHAGVREGRCQGALIVAAMHLAVLGALWHYQPAREALAAAMPIMVEFITPPRTEPRREKPAPVLNPVPVRQQPDPLPQVVAAPVEAPVTQVAPPPEPVRPAAPVVAEAPAAVAPPAPLPVIPPRFDAAYLDNPSPAYPSQARRLREQGKVLLRVLVTPGGTAERVELRGSSGSHRLDEAALDTVKRWRFVPARRGTEAVAAWVLVPISFVLEG